MIELLVAIQTGHDSSDAFMLEGWGEAEGGHRWTMGAESRMRLPVPADPHCIVVIGLKPLCDPVFLPAQTIMFSINGRLMATVQMTDQRILAMPMPAGIMDETDAVLGIFHLNSRTARPGWALSHDSRPLGLMVMNVHVFRRSSVAHPPSVLKAVPGRTGDGSLQAAAMRLTGLPPDRLAECFESLGQNCEFGLIQRGLGAEPVGLLRFAGTVTHMLFDGLMKGFQGAGAAESTRVFLSDEPEPEFKLHEQRYYLWYSVGRTGPGVTHDAIRLQQCRRLTYLQRKFVEDLRNGEKIFVLTRAEIMTEQEALAIFCALQIEGPNTMLWTVHGEPARAGQVDCLMPGFLRGHLGAVDERIYATMDAWLSVMTNAHVLHRGNSLGSLRPHATNLSV